MKTIQLTQGKVAFVDDEDFDWLSQSKWHAVEMKPRTLPPYWYARRFCGRSPEYMHSAILKRMGYFQDCDHKDGNALNNQRSNLRPCSDGQNNANRRKQIGTTSNYKGVSFCKSRGLWEAKIGINLKRQFLGRYQIEIDAAMAYDAAAIVYFGEFARLNFPA